MSSSIQQKLHSSVLVPLCHHSAYVKLPPAGQSIKEETVGMIRRMIRGVFRYSEDMRAALSRPA